MPHSATNGIPMKLSTILIPQAPLPLKKHYSHMHMFPLPRKKRKKNLIHIRMTQSIFISIHACY